MKPKRLIVFDMDGVIIDVSRSYRDTVRQTAKLFFKAARSWEDLPDPLFQLSDLARVKQSGGLNNDWDLTCLIINLLFSLVKTPKIHEDPDNWYRYQKTINRCDVAILARFLQSTNRPLTTLLEKKGKLTNNFIMSLYVDDVGCGNIIKQIFQEIYLGKDLFESTYGMPPKVYYGEGYIYRENLLVKKSILEYLSKNNILAIATGRPKAEADYPLDFFDLRKYFTFIYTLDDCITEEKKILKQEGKKVSISKPNPYILDIIADTKKQETSEFYYIGDMPDDMVAASQSRAGFIGIGVLLSAPDKAHLKKDLLRAGADYIIEDIEELKGIIESNERKNRRYQRGQGA
jgi:phosphoglycolate phosphatase-like HAD superfamily hydrolase